jgi:ribosomal protein S18 acetylase RimI-like enzyme
VSPSGPDQPQVRRARYEDWPAIARLLREIDELHAALAPQYFRATTRDEGEWRRILVDPTSMVFVATLGAFGAPPVGLLSIRVYDTPADPAMVPRRRGHVETLVVAPHRRRRGIGRSLLAEATAWARAQGAVELVLTSWSGNADADAFYESLGYQVLSRVLHRGI